MTMEKERMIPSWDMDSHPPTAEEIKAVNEKAERVAALWSALMKDARGRPYHTQVIPPPDYDAAA
jgi:predicted GTPase